MQKDDAVLVLDGVEMNVGAAIQFGGKGGELEIMGGKQRHAAVVERQLTSDRPSKRQAIEG